MKKLAVLLAFLVLLCFTGIAQAEWWVSFYEGTVLPGQLLAEDNGILNYRAIVYRISKGDEAHLVVYEKVGVVGYSYSVIMKAGEAAIFGSGGSLSIALVSLTKTGEARFSVSIMNIFPRQ
ncbi:MAG: hypothetical protein HY764_01410 [Candidatus Portnoybacteria bacterium]|nr:hypothetical protein [Candidatus Portnoybacteria bacterium]